LNHLQGISNDNERPFYSIGSTEHFRLASFYFPPNCVVHLEGIAYDQYSINELGQTRPGLQWLTFPLPHELGRTDYPAPWQPPISRKFNFPLQASPLTKSTLAFIEQIYVVSEQSFIDRHEHLKRVFRRHSIPIDSIKWQFVWARKQCSSNSSHDQVRKILNSKPGKKEDCKEFISLKRISYFFLIFYSCPVFWLYYFSIGFRIRSNFCPVIMKHLDAWHDIAMRQLPLALILEDDPLFVPFFKEKLNRVIYTSIRTGALRIDKTCISRPNKSISNNEWIHQEPMFVIGACLDMHEKVLFQLSNRNASPILSTQKQSPSRCAHAYLLTACSARALIEEIALNYTKVDTPDHLMNALFKTSPILQSFWLDPPIVYQGNRVDDDLDDVPTFKETKYNLPF
jgi:hypothetical protein